MNPFPSIDEQTKPIGLFEPPLRKPLYMHPPKYSNPNINPNPIYSGPDWTPNFEEKIDVESDSVRLALYVLGISKAEYNSMSIQELKEQKRIDLQTSHIYALNILIHYKKNSKLILPQLSPIKHKSNFDFNSMEINNGSYGFTKDTNFSPNAKIYPEFDNF